MDAPRYNEAWNRQELILALFLYCQTPFSKTKDTNPEVIQLAKFLGRTPASVARKLGNFGAFDPLLAQRGISGLSHSSKADRAIWEEFNGRWDDLVTESHKLLQGALVIRIESEPASDTRHLPVRIGVNRTVTTKARLGQSFFRRTVLSSYRNACCMCSLDIPGLLIGSHIIPWSVHEGHRLDPQNGLCLCSLHDKAFDLGLLSIGPDYSILVSSELHLSRSDFAHHALTRLKDARILLPERFAPLRECLAWHNEHRFRG